MIRQNKQKNFMELTHEFIKIIIMSDIISDKRNYFVSNTLKTPQSHADTINMQLNPSYCTNILLIRHMNVK